jgi:hypothetical protein
LSTPHDPGILAASLEGRLDPREREALTSHLAGCDECRQALALLARAAHEGLIPQPTPAVSRGVAWHRWLPLAAALVIGVATLTRQNWWAAPVAEPVPSQAPAGASTSPPVTQSETVPSPASSPVAAEPRSPSLEPGVLVTRGAGRRVAGKTFRLAKGEWTDASFDPAAGLPIRDVTGPDQRSSVLSLLPGLAPYAALGDRVLVVFDGTVYRFLP